jgi:hypothetical protein
VANYDPEMFENPLEFDIDRNPNDALAFSYGQHRCIGMSVARLESKIAFEELLARFPHIEPRGRAMFRPSTATAVVESARRVPGGGSSGQVMEIREESGVTGPDAVSVSGWLATLGATRGAPK